MIRSYIYIGLFLSIIFLSFCNKQKKDIENVLLEEYIAENFGDPKFTIDTIQDKLYLIKTGFSSPETLNSDLPTQGDTIISVYKGYLLSNNELVFDEAGTDNPQYYVFQEDPVIQGWEMSIARMKKDVSAIMIIHSDYAYKGNQVGLIPPFSTLIYEVRIYDIIKSD